MQNVERVLEFLDQHPDLKKEMKELWDEVNDLKAKVEKHDQAIEGEW